MSGICGFISGDENDPVDAARVGQMLRALDITNQDSGSSVALKSVCLGAKTFLRRLSGVKILSRQGVESALAFHGNIYNLDEVISGAGRDTDSLLELLGLYLEKGIEVVQRLRGEFALAVWDGREQTLHLVTDRFRVQPIFYYHDNQTLVFGSRIQAIIASRVPLNLSIDGEAVIDVVGSSMIPTPKTIFREVKKLPPGYVLTYRKGEKRLTQYWDIDFINTLNWSELKLARELKSVFREAVAVRLLQDSTAENVGCFLSGGVDSSTVTGVLRQLTNAPVKCFSIGFAEQQFNEISYARLAAQAFGATHHEYFVSPEDVYNVIPVLLNAFDEPFANASAIPTYFCANLARSNGVSVLYAGDGGDELFAGNERYATQRLFDYYQEIPSWLRDSVLTPTVFTLADTLEWGVLVKGKKYIQRSNVPYPERLYSYGFLKNIAMADWFSEILLEGVGNFVPYAETNSHYFHAKAQTALDRQLYVDLKLVISDNDLFKVTRMTEAAGVEVRYPFLDHHLAEFAAKVPATLKMRGRQLRIFFKNAYADLLPRQIRAKQKHGFGLPIPVWLRTNTQLNEMMHDLVLSPRSIQRGYFRRMALEQLVELHKTDGTSFYGTILWNLMVLELWHRRYMDSGAVR